MVGAGSGVRCPCRTVYLPCVLPLIPGYLTFASGTREVGGSPLLPLGLFFLGFASVFIALGASMSALRSSDPPRGLRISGAIVVLFGCAMLLYAFQVRWTQLHTEGGRSCRR
jgi:cytochrome c biogenesis protein CcdA